MPPKLLWCKIVPLLHLLPNNARSRVELYVNGEVNGDGEDRHA